VRQLRALVIVGLVVALGIGVALSVAGGSAAGATGLRRGFAAAPRGDGPRVAPAVPPRRGLARGLPGRGAPGPGPPRQAGPAMIFSM